LQTWVYDNITLDKTLQNPLGMLWIRNFWNPKGVISWKLKHDHMVSIGKCFLSPKGLIF
jgi:hypothetical protein